MTDKNGEATSEMEGFKTIEQHWAHFLERDIAPTAPVIQVMEMKRAFAAGAISGVQLAVTASRAPLLAHIEAIKGLVMKTGET